jgi:hypothetical protein
MENVVLTSSLMSHNVIDFVSMKSLIHSVANSVNESDYTPVSVKMNTKPPQWLQRQPYEPAYPAHRSSNLPNTHRRTMYTILQKYIDQEVEKEKGYQDVDKDIQKSLLSLLPDISYEYEHTSDRKTLPSLVLWIQNAKHYMDQLSADFHDACRYILHKNMIFHGQVERSILMEMKQVDRLPEDMVRNIVSYFTPETRLAFLQDTIDLVSHQLQLLTMSWLKNIYRKCLHNRYIDNVVIPFNTFRHDKIEGLSFTKKQYIAMREYINRKRALMPYGLPTNKTMAINRIMDVLRMYQQTSDIAPTNYLKYRFCSEGLRLLHSIVYAIRCFQEKKRIGRNRHHSVMA